MVRNRIVFLMNGTPTSLDITPRVHRPIGWASLDPAPTVLADYEGRTLAGILGHLGAERIPRRYAVAFPAAETTRVEDQLAEIMGRGSYFDSAWVCLRASTLSGEASGADFVGLLTLAQVKALRESRPSRCYLLENGAAVRSVDPLSPPAERDVRSIQNVGASYRDGWIERQLSGDEMCLTTTPSNPFADLLRATHSYYAVIHPCHRRRLNADYISVRSFFLEDEYPGLHCSVPVRPLFDERVDPARIVLDATTHYAIGQAQGEPVGVRIAAGRAIYFRSAVFGNRHCMARVGRTSTVDIEKPVTRMPDAMFDLLGVGPGARVVVEAISQEDPPRVRRISLRSLARRERSSLLLARMAVGVPDFHQFFGDEDFPRISLDLISRNRLRISPGTAVYVRPALSSVLAQEFTAASFVLIGALFSAAALQSVALAATAAVLYVLLSLVLLIARLR